jgi:hypothetical protein
VAVAERLVDHSGAVMAARQVPADPGLRKLQGLVTYLEGALGIRWKQRLRSLLGGGITFAACPRDRAVLIVDAADGDLLARLQTVLLAFAKEEAKKRDGTLDRVLLMTFSEFGRTVAENGRHGTGHGAAAPVFLAGGKVKGGLVGSHPSLTDLDAGALKVQTDFRRVYATALDRWLGIDSRSVLDRVYEPVDVLGT